MLLYLIDYAIDLAASLILLLCGYHYQSWLLRGVGLLAFVLTVVAKNIAAWRGSKDESNLENSE